MLKTKAYPMDKNTPTPSSSREMSKKQQGKGTKSPSVTVVQGLLKAPSEGEQGLKTLQHHRPHTKHKETVDHCWSKIK